MNTIQKYTKIAILLHWLIAIVIAMLFCLGWYMTELPKEGPKQLGFDLFDLGIYTWNLAQEASPRTFYFNLHKSIGFTLLVLVVIRFIWKLLNKPPAMLTSYKDWERKLATGTHHLLYLLMFAMPISGLMMSLNSKYGVSWFGMHVLDGVDNKELRHTFEGVHEFIGTVLLVIVGLHFIGALKHKFIDKDNTLSRMTLK
jgi:cytochrome b561